jgi:hypothetical protein
MLEKNQTFFIIEVKFFLLVVSISAVMLFHIYVFDRLGVRHFRHGDLCLRARLLAVGVVHVSASRARARRGLVERLGLLFLAVLSQAGESVAVLAVGRAAQPLAQVLLLRVELRAQADELELLQLAHVLEASDGGRDDHENERHDQKAHDEH